MRPTVRACVVALLAAVALAAGGCGRRYPKVQGRVLLGGRPLRAGPGESAQVIFLSTGTEHRSTPANCNGEDGTFTVAGVDGRGVPPGKYRVAVACYDADERDRFNGAFGPNKSPLYCEVTDAKEQHVVIDLDKKTVTAE